MNTNTPEATLEQLVDQLGLVTVLEHLTDICAGKGMHIRENWQDEASARPWTKAASRLEQVSMHSTIRAVSPPPIRVSLAELAQRVTR